ncbi:acyloxyacyl hydrolase [Dethiosulfatarculus sandiegensis]|uniref:Lipid A 3-O-deacylase n=1 Tax=Dethiosulfatarculus sandiegensis TaxID=1429043 RepID=A0A0D2JB50_9BACT|nr:acyloxyacyl hydrolase [Dethiosulfatarculus sandiegensis]KIX15354.1 lipid A 3-O-deacylase [Dethiosulfatarculus sandiegensis]
MRQKTLALLTGILLLVLVPGTTASAEAFFKSWGISYYICEDMDLDNEDLKAMGLLLHFDAPLTTWKAFELVFRLEGQAGGYWNYGAGMETALIPALRANLLCADSFKPYLEGGIGPSFNELDIYEMGSNLNFTSFAGMGFSWLLKKAMGIETGVRLRHISNAGLDERNHGVTSAFFHFGFILYF